MQKTVSSIFLTLIFLFTLSEPNGFAEDSTRWRLPEGATARLGKGSITQIAYSPNGKHLAVAGSIGIWLYDMTTYQEVALLTENTGSVSSVAFSPDGKTIVSGSDAGSVQLWDVNTGKRSQTFTEDIWRIRNVEFSPDGSTIASSSVSTEDSNSVIDLWNVPTGGSIKTLDGHRHDILSVSFSPDGKTLVSGAQWGDNNICLWDVHTGELLNTLTGHERFESVNSVIFSPDGNVIASDSYDESIQDKVIRLWDVHTGKLLKTLTMHIDQVNCLIYNVEKNTIIAGGWVDGEEGAFSGEIHLWDVHTSEHIKTLTVDGFNGVMSIVFSPDENTFVCGDTHYLGLGGRIHVWNANTWEHLKTLIGPTSAVDSLAFSPDGKTLASGGADGTILLWDFSTPP